MINKNIVKHMMKLTYLSSIENILIEANKTFLYI